MEPKTRDAKRFVIAIPITRGRHGSRIASVSGLPIMDEVVVFAEGLPYPFAPAENMRFELSVMDGELRITVELFIDEPSRRELAELRSGPLRLSVVPAPPVSWLVLTTATLAYDGPYFLSVEERSDAADIADALSRLEAVPLSERRSILFYVVDKRDKSILVATLLSVSAAWIQALGAAVLAGAGEVADMDHGKALERDYERWPQVRLMLPAATASEIAGRV